MPASLPKQNDEEGLIFFTLRAGEVELSIQFIHSSMPFHLQQAEIKHVTFDLSYMGIEKEG
jgi:hypothetical protein